MSTHFALWMASIVAAVWFLVLGTIRLLAHRSGTDQTRGMYNVARLALTLGVIAAVAAVVLGVTLL